MGYLLVPLRNPKVIKHILIGFPIHFFANMYYHKHPLNLRIVTLWVLLSSFSMFYGHSFWMLAIFSTFVHPVCLHVRIIYISTMYANMYVCTNDLLVSWFHVPSFDLKLKVKCYPQKELKSMYKWPDITILQEEFPNDGQVMEVPHMLAQTLINVGSGLLSGGRIYRGQNPHREELQKLWLLSIKQKQNNRKWLKDYCTMF